MELADAEQAKSELASLPNMFFVNAFESVPNASDEVVDAANSSAPES